MPRCGRAPAAAAAENARRRQKDGIAGRLAAAVAGTNERTDGQASQRAIITEHCRPSPSNLASLNRPAYLRDTAAAAAAAAAAVETDKQDEAT